jgi:uncharacterized protein YbjT (DUF2867 family)
MAAENKTALVVGATGLIGNLVVEELLRSDKYTQVKVLVRKPLQYQHPKLTTTVVDFDALNAALINADDVYCCLGTTMKKAGSKEAFYKVDYTYPHQLAQIAKANGTKRFSIVTAMGADSKSLFYYNRVKGEIEESLRKLGFEAFIVFRPSLLLGNRPESRLGEQMGESLMKLFRPLIPEKYRAIEASKVAKAMVLITASHMKGNLVYESDVLQEF